uniref:Metalloendopeptidase n=1 Tax=Megacormus gertschi TaxID=1843536 RepID=A0A224XEZ8_9SCOR
MSLKLAYRHLFVVGVLLLPCSAFLIQDTREISSVEGRGRLLSRTLRSTGKVPKTWPGGVVPFVVDKTLIVYPAYRRVIQKAMNNIEKKSCVRFKYRTKEKDYIRLVLSKRCSSNIGKKGGRQILRLHVSCVNIGIVLHELMHALGFNHEHTRYDRDKYLIVHKNNLPEDVHRKYEARPSNTFQTMTGYSYNSIMHYSRKDESLNGKDTLVPIKPGIKLIPAYKKTSLSPIDVKRINILYPCTNLS